MSIHSEIARIAQAEVGVREEGGNNLGPRIRLYQSATWLDPGPWPWCAAFTAWVLRQALITSAGQAWLGARREGAESFRCRDASAFGWIKWAERRDLSVFDERSATKPAPGDFVVFDFSHIGVVIRDLGDRIETVEGNTNGRGERDSESGDGVWRKTRSISLVRAYLRLPEAP